MKAMVVYDSYYGNTKAVAEAIVEELEAEGHEAELRSVREHPREPPRGDILFLGSPVRLGSVTGRVKRFVKKSDGDAWGEKPIVVFTTILALPPDATDDQKESREKYDIAAGRKLRDLARSRNLNAVEDHLWVDVEGNKGPLVETGVEETRRFVRDLLSSLND